MCVGCVGGGGSGAGVGGGEEACMGPFILEMISLPYLSLLLELDNLNWGPG